MMATAMATQTDEYTSILLQLFDKSILKRAKFTILSQMLGDPTGKTLLDIGADNGVISYLLRRKGGRWSSADLEAGTVASIRALVKDNVFQISGEATPFADDEFDTVVIVDFLEHIADDRGFVGELHRIVKPGGTVIINVPHLKRPSLIRAIRLAVGLTDEKHGHVRPGYTIRSLRELLAPSFAVERSRTYSRFFTELIDVFISLAVEMAGGADQSRKGTVVTGADLSRHRKKFRMYCWIYPFIKLVSLLDYLLLFTRGHSLVVRASACTQAAPTPLTAAGA